MSMHSHRFILFSWKGVPHSNHVFLLGAIACLSLYGLLFHQTRFYTSFRSSRLVTLEGRVDGDDRTVNSEHPSELAVTPPNQNYDPVKNQTLGFEKVFILSMPHRLDRRDAMTIIAASSNIDMEYRDGVDGNQVHEKALPTEWARESWTSGQLGCLRGYMNILAEMIQDKISTALLFEDDASWDVSIKHQLAAFAVGARFIQNTSTSSTPHSPYGDDWDILHIGHCGQHTRLKDRRRFAVERGPTITPPSRRWSYGGIPDITGFADDTRVVYTSESGLCTSSFAVSNRGARKLLTALGDANRPLDMMLQQLCSDKTVDCIGVWPAIIGVHKAAGLQMKDSDIVEEGDDFREKGFTHNIVFDVRMNLDKLMNGQTDFRAQFPEDLEKLEYPQEEERL